MCGLIIKADKMFNKLKDFLQRQCWFRVKFISSDLPFSIYRIQYRLWFLPIWFTFWKAVYFCEAEAYKDIEKLKNCKLGIWRGRYYD